MSSDSRNKGLNELGQRMQAMSDPVPEPRLRPYPGAQPPVAPASNGRPNQRHPDQPPTQIPTQTPAQVSSQAPVPDVMPRPVPVSAWKNGAASESGAAPAPAAATLQVYPNAPKSGIQRAINAVRSTLPLVQRLLPLLDGNFATAIGALVAPQSHPHPAPQAVQVNLEPVERGLAEVRNSHRELRGQVLEQVTNLKRVEDQLERVREATDRNTLEQQEFVENLRSVGSRISTFAIIGLALLVISLGLNIYFLFQLQHILR